MMFPSVWRPSALALSITLAGCSSTASEPDLDAEIQRIVRQSIDNMVFVKGGSFEMGDFGQWTEEADGSRSWLPWTADTDDDHLHQVTLDSYHIGKYEVTWEEFDVFSRATGREIYSPDTSVRGPNLPVYAPNWHEASSYCLWLAKQSGLPFDLPTEAQWEYAARSLGQNVPYATDDGTIDRGGRNIKGFNEGGGKPYPGPHYPANPLGLHHMSGNLSEYVKDWYGEDYYEHSPELNPQGPEAGTVRVYRDSSFYGSARFATTVNRAKVDPNEDRGDVGIRCAINQNRLLR